MRRSCGLTCRSETGTLDRMPRNRPSLTALKIARTVVYLAHDPELAAMLPPGAGEWTERLLRHAGRISDWHLAAYRRLQPFLEAMERRTVPGMTLHVALRKRFFDDEARAAITGGATQVLVVGAGYDTLCPRLAAEHPGVRFVEVDHPGTSTAKRGAAEGLGAGRSNLRFLAVDLAATALDEALAGTGEWDRRTPSLVIAEGLLMYLDESAVAAFLDRARRACGRDSRLAFSYLESDAAGTVGGDKIDRLTRAVLRVVGEPLLWGPRAGELGAFLEEHGWRLAGEERCDLRRRYLEPAGLGEEPAGKGLEQLAIALLAADR